MTQAEATQELPARTPGRAARIAAIRMLADFLEEHPEYPAPDSLTADPAPLSRNTRPDLDEDQRCAIVREWAKANDARIVDTHLAVFAETTIADHAVHGVGICYRYWALKDPTDGEL